MALSVVFRHPSPSLLGRSTLDSPGALPFLGQFGLDLNNVLATPLTTRHNTSVFASKLVLST